MSDSSAMSPPLSFTYSPQFASPPPSIPEPPGSVSQLSFFTLTTANTLSTDNEIPTGTASQISNVPSPRTGNDSPRARIWLSQENQEKEKKEERKITIRQAASRKRAHFAQIDQAPANQIGNWLGLVVQPTVVGNMGPDTALTVLPAIPSGPLALNQQPMYDMPEPLPLHMQQANEHTRRLIKHYINKMRTEEKHSAAALAKETKEKEDEAKRAKDLEKKVGRLEREKKKLEERLEKPSAAKPAVAKPAASKPATSKPAAPKKPAAAAKKAAAKKAAVKETATKLNVGARETRSMRAERRVAEREAAGN